MVRPAPIKLVRASFAKPWIRARAEAFWAQHEAGDAVEVGSASTLIALPP